MAIYKIMVEFDKSLLSQKSVWGRTTKVPPFAAYN
jgi:hypothetical protein